MDNQLIIVIGHLKPLNTKGNWLHIQDRVYYEEGIAPAMNGRDYKSPRLILINGDNHDK